MAHMLVPRVRPCGSGCAIPSSVVRLVQRLSEKAVFEAKMYRGHFGPRFWPQGSRGSALGAGLSAGARIYEG